jgi:hypothetical protein
LESRCPAGQVPSTIHSYQGFEAGLPFPDPLLTDGFTIMAGAGVNRRRFGFWDDGDGADVAGRRLTQCIGERVFAG